MRFVLSLLFAAAASAQPAQVTVIKAGTLIDGRSSETRRNQTVVIRGDEKANWKYIARVMSLCNQAKIKDYRVAVVPDETP